MGPPGERDEAWFTAVYTEHYPQVVRYALRRLADPDASVELAQEVFVVAWRRRTQVPRHSLPWLYAVARRLLANRWRAVRGTPPVTAVADPELLRAGAGPGYGDPESVAAVADVRAALAGLSELDQEVLRLVGWEELTVGEAATVLGCTRAAAAVRLHRARRRLAAALDRPTPPVSPSPAPVQA
jgi:RNA polymerase sigma factor (sigma-70 family)